MGDFGNAIKYLYREFILRDILSFVTPGAIIVMAVLYFFFSELLFPSYSIHWLLYIPLFGVFYLVGFAVQCFGEFLGIISFSPPDEYPWPLKQRWNILNPIGAHWTKDKDIVWWNKYYKKMEEFWKVTKSDEEAQQRRERLIVLKQMCANGFLSILIAGIFFGVSFCSFLCVKFLVVSVVAFLLTASLFWGYRVHVLRQYAREKIIVSSRQENK